MRLNRFQAQFHTDSHQIKTYIMIHLVPLFSLISLSAAVSPENIKIIQQQSAFVAEAALSRGINNCLLKWVFFFFSYHYFLFFFSLFWYWVNKGWVLKKGIFKNYSGLYLWKEQEFKIVEEVRPTLFFIFREGHISSTILNSCSFQRYRLL